MCRREGHSQTLGHKLPQQRQHLCREGILHVDVMCTFMQLHTLHDGEPATRQAPFSLGLVAEAERGCHVGSVYAINSKARPQTC